MTRETRVTRMTRGTRGGRGVVRGYLWRSGAEEMWMNRKMDCLMDCLID